jgi:hypothetical protein
MIIVNTVYGDCGSIDIYMVTGLSVSKDESWFFPGKARQHSHMQRNSSVLYEL